MRTAWMLPREHGAYGELLFPLVSALLVGRPAESALLLAASATLAFFAYEPLRIVQGMRGSRQRRELGTQAFRRAAVVGGLAVVCAGAGLWVAPRLALWACVPPAVLAAVTTWLGSAGHEKTFPAELLAAATLSFGALPVAFAGGVPFVHAVALALVWTVTFGLATATGRAIAKQAKGEPSTRWIVGGSGVLIVIAAVGAVLLGWLPPRYALAPLPSVVLALGLVVRPVPPAKIRTVGWALVAASGMTLAILVLGARI